VLSAIATAIISVTSAVFSTTIVALTLAAGQFGSRVLHNFMRDRGNQITCGASLPTRFDVDAKAVRASKGDQLQVVDHARLMDPAVEHDLVVPSRTRPGHFVVEGGIGAHVWKDGDLEPELLEEVRGVFVFGRSRSLQQDAEFGILQFGEVAVRARSSGIHDPFTAMNRVDRISSLLSRPWGARLPPGRALRRRGPPAGRG
jgi:uncharacterized membrane protein